MAEVLDVIAERRRWWVLPLAVLSVAGVLTVPFYVSDLDIAVARWLNRVNQAHGGAWHDVWYWRIAYYLPAAMAGGLGLGCIIALVRGLLRPAHRPAVRPAVYLLLALVLGPGLLCNAILKDHWGRPRPRETVELGGAWSYRVPWDKGPAGRGKSFPSGHASIPPLAFAMWLLWRRHRRGLARWCLAGGVLLTAYVGAVRMLAGGHWLSDVLWSATLVFVLSALLHRLIVLAPQRAQAPPAGPGRPRWLIHTGTALLAALLACAVLLMTPIYRDIALRLEADSLGAGPWRLEVAADGADVQIELKPGAQPILLATGEIQGFGWPGSTVEREVRAADGVATVRLKRQGRMLSLTTSLRLTVDPAHLSGVTVRLGSGNVTVRCSDPALRVPIEAVTGAGEVRLPVGWLPFSADRAPR